MELSAAQVGNSKINSYIEEEVKIVLFAGVISSVMLKTGLLP